MELNQQEKLIEREIVLSEIMMLIIGYMQTTAKLLEEIQNKPHKEPQDITAMDWLNKTLIILNHVLHPALHGVADEMFPNEIARFDNYRLNLDHIRKNKIIPTDCDCVPCKNVESSDIKESNV